MNNGAIPACLCLLLAVCFPKIGAAEPYETEIIEKVSIPLLAERPQKLMIGETEDVMLVPWAVVLPARIDTGARLSSLDARDLSVQNNIAEFMLDKRYGGLRLRLPVVDWVEVRSSAGVEKRPVVEVGICLGPKLIRTAATLSDRSHMIYPFLVGRNVLNGSFMVDTSRSNAVRPQCHSTLSLSGF
jgi:hypothetical protein